MSSFVSTGSMLHFPWPWVPLTGEKRDWVDECVMGVGGGEIIEAVPPSQTLTYAASSTHIPRVQEMQLYLNSPEAVFWVRHSKYTPKTLQIPLLLYVRLCVLFTQSCPTLCDPILRLYPARLLCPWDFPGKKTRVFCHSLLQGIFLTQGSNLGLLHCTQII